MREFRTVDGSKMLKAIAEGNDLSKTTLQHIKSMLSLVRLPESRRELMSAAQLDVLPVVSRANINHVEGILTLQDVLDSYGFSTSGRSSWSCLTSGVAARYCRLPASSVSASPSARGNHPSSFEKAIDRE
jgi:hypothetical protein